MAKTLKEAGSAYASLIYELTPKTSYFEFMGLCETVCSHLESDSKVARKLIDISDQIELLNEVKRMKGNVELESLKQAKDINKFGVYSIGCVGRNDHNRVDFNYERFFKLNVDDDKHQERVYDFTQLEQLQNVLMLGTLRDYWVYFEWC